MTCSGTRAAELALRLKYAGVPTERIVVEPDLDARRSTRRSRRGDGPALRPADLHGDARAARRCSSRAASRGGSLRDDADEP